MNDTLAARFRAAYFALGYVVVVLIVDTLAAHGVQFPVDWRILRLNVGGADLFKFIAWFVVPLALCARSLEPGYLTFARWRPIDWAILGVVVIGGAVVMVLLPYLPEMGDYYRGWGGQPVAERISLMTRQLLWTASWLIGWEFMHRYWLPKTMLDAWPQRGWIAVLVTVPTIEALYHLIQAKPFLECIGMGLLSLAFSAWVIRRRNAMLPFLGHLAIEIELILFLFFAD